MKGMQKIKRGSGFRGVLNYVLDGGKLLGGNMSATDPLNLSREFGVTRRIRSDIEKPVWHNSLRLPKGEKISHEKWVEIADDYMQKMGFEPEHMRSYVLHDDEDGQHIHIVASRVGLDGSVYLGKNENLKSTRHIAKLEEIHGLTITPGPKVDESGKVIMPEKKRLKKGEIEQALRTGKEPPRQKLQRLLDEALKGRPTVLQFAERMEAAGVVVIANMAKTTDKMNGFSFRIDGVPFSASQAGEKYKWSRLTKVIDYDEVRDSAGLRQYTVAARADRNDQAATESDRAHAASAPDAAEPRRLSEPDRAVGTGVGDSNGRKQGIAFKASQLGRAYGWPRLSERIDYDADKHAVLLHQYVDSGCEIGKIKAINDDENRRIADAAREQQQRITAFRTAAIKAIATLIVQILQRQREIRATEEAIKRSRNRAASIIKYSSENVEHMIAHMRLFIEQDAPTDFFELMRKEPLELIHYVNDYYQLGFYDEFITWFHDVNAENIRLCVENAESTYTQTLDAVQLVMHKYDNAQTAKTGFERGSDNRDYQHLTDR